MNNKGLHPLQIAQIPGFSNWSKTSQRRDPAIGLLVKCNECLAHSTRSLLKLYVG